MPEGIQYDSEAKKNQRDHRLSNPKGFTANGITKIELQNVNHHQSIDFAPAAADKTLSSRHSQTNLFQPIHSLFSTIQSDR